MWHVHPTDRGVIIGRWPRNLTVPCSELGHQNEMAVWLLMRGTVAVPIGYVVEIKVWAETAREVRN